MAYFSIFAVFLSSRLNRIERGFNAISMSLLLRELHHALHNMKSFA